MNDVRETDLTRGIPESLKSDPQLFALGRVIGGELQKTVRASHDAVIFARIDELPEWLLDVLARDFSVGWYKDSYPLEVKRRLIKTCVRVHKRQGTKFAVEEAIGAIYPRTEIAEWFEYGGEPHHFRVNLDISGLDPADRPDIDEIRDTVWLYKRLSAWLDGIFYVINIESAATISAAAASISDRRISQKLHLDLTERIAAANHSAIHAISAAAADSRVVQSMKIKL
jgi:phage tail P2-like protein